MLIQRSWCQLVCGKVGVASRAAQCRHAMRARIKARLGGEFAGLGKADEDGRGGEEAACIACIRDSITKEDPPNAREASLRKSSLGDWLRTFLTAARALRTRGSVLVLCLSCACLVLVLCSSCACLVLVLCSSCACLVLVLCSSCARLVLVLCLSCARLVLVLCSSCARLVLVLCVADAPQQDADTSKTALAVRGQPPKNRFSLR